MVAKVAKVANYKQKICMPSLPMVRYLWFATYGSLPLVANVFEEVRWIANPSPLQSEPTTTHRMSLGLPPIRHLWWRKVVNSLFEDVTRYLQENLLMILKFACSPPKWRTTDYLRKQILSPPMVAKVANLF